MRYIFTVAATAGVSAVALAGAAAAQDLPDRTRPYDPIGVRAGAFLLFPEFAVTAVADDNAFATETDTQDDLYLTVSPSAELRSNWSVHSLTFRGRYLDRLEGDAEGLGYRDWSVGAAGRFDLARESSLRAEVSYRDGAEPLSESPTVGIVAPVEFTQSRVAVGGTWTLNRVRLGADVDYSVFDFEDGRLFSGAVSEQDDRDRAVTTVRGRADYGFATGAAAFVSVGYNVRAYDLGPPQAVFDRDSDGYEVLVGLAAQASRLVRGEVGLGYFDQSYEDPASDNVSGLGARAAVFWAPDPIWEFGLRVDRGVSDPGVSEAASALSTGVVASADYEFRRNVLLGAEARYNQDEFRGVDREDERVGGAIEGEYLINRVAAISLRLDHDAQRATGSAPGREYDRTVASLRLRLRR